MEPRKQRKGEQVGETQSLSYFSLVRVAITAADQERYQVPLLFSDILTNTFWYLLKAWKIYRKDKSAKRYSFTD